MARKTAGKARLKLVSVGSEKLLLLRLVSGEQARKDLDAQLRGAIALDRISSDGEMFSIRGEPAIKTAWDLVRPACDATYDPNLSPGLAALPNPWPIAAEPLRDRANKAIIYMALVRHPELGEALAFQSPVYDDDFMMDFRRELSDGKRWRLFRKDLDNIPVWVVAEFYAGRAHDVLDRYFECWWDEFLAGEEWDIMPPPANTQYPIRKLSDQDFRVLGVTPYAGIDDINKAYREQKDGYLNNRVHVEQWLDIDVAYQRIRRYHFPKEPELPEVVVAPIEIILLLRRRFPDSEAERVDWFYSHNDRLRAVPAQLVESPEGLERVADYLLNAPPEPETDD